jgi:hypothetical protein
MRFPTGQLLWHNRRTAQLGYGGVGDAEVSDGESIRKEKRGPT